MSLENLTKAELLEFIKSQEQARTLGLTVKVTAKGGIYIQSSEFKEYSEAKQKTYTAGINLGMNTARALFNNQALIDAIRDEVNKLGKK